VDVSANTATDTKGESVSHFGGDARFVIIEIQRLYGGFIAEVSPAEEPDCHLIGLD
jgi:hypothetical protein